MVECAHPRKKLILALKGSVARDRNCVRKIHFIVLFCSAGRILKGQVHEIIDTLRRQSIQTARGLAPDPKSGQGEEYYIYMQFIP